MKNNLGLRIGPKTSVLFATFSLWLKNKRLPTNGSVEPFRDFLVPKVGTLVLIDQLVPGSEDVSYKVEHYISHKPADPHKSLSFWFILLKPILALTNKNGTQIPFKIRDFLSVIDVGIGSHSIFDYFVGLESINAIAGILLRTFGKVKKVIYYVSDYSPNRYANSIFNTVYLWLDRYAARHADFIWDVSPAMQTARIKAGLDPKKSAPVILVGNGLFADQIVHNVIGRKPHDLVYMGTLGPENGPDVAIETLALVRKKYSDARLHMIGGSSSDFLWLSPLVTKLNLSDAVVHHGFVPISADMVNIMSKCAIGLAPYRAIPGSARFYGDAGKIRAYCGASLPIVTSDVPPLGRLVAGKKAAIVTKDTPEDFAAAIIKIFSDNLLYKKLEANAKAFARYNTWENQFFHAFKTMESYG